MTSKNVRYWVGLIMALTFLIGFIFPAVVTGNESTVGLTDISGHWAKDKITEWVEKGLVSGYTDGTFKPDKSITRAEFMTLVNKAFGFGEEAAIGFSDVANKDWFYGEVAKAVKAGYISGYQDGTVKPNQIISRQEAAVVLCKASDIEAKDTDEIKIFTDAESIPLWSGPYICALVDKGYMGGYPDGSFKAERHITRAETVTMLDKALGRLTVSYDVAGIYGPEEGIETISQDVAINMSDVTLRNMIIEGNLYLNEGIGEGDVTLDNVTVKGTTTVRGGGKNSIHLVNFTGQEIIVIKVGGKVRIVASGDTTVEELILESGAHIEGNGIASVTVLKPGEDVILDGEFENVIIEAEVNVEVLEGTTINNLQVNSSADINLYNGATVKGLTLDAPAAITGQGTIEAAQINASGATLELEPKEYKLAEGVTAEIAGKEVKEEEKKSPGGGGGGGPSEVKVTGISVSPTTMTLKVGDKRTIIATIIPSDATNNNVNWTTSNANVAIVANGVVTAKAVGTATITATSVADSSKKASCTVTVEKEEEVDKTALVSEIEKALSKVDKASVGEEVGNYPQSAVDALNTAIKAAQAVVDKAGATQEEVNAEVTKLQQAIATFEAAVVTAPGTYKVTVLSNPADGGTVTVTDAVYFKEGDMVTVKAEPNEGFEFINWTREDVTEEITNNPYTFNMPAKNVSLTANFQIITSVVDPTIKVNKDLALKSAVGLYDCFSVSTTPGSYESDIVRVKMEVTSENVTDLVNAFALEYVEQNPENPNYRQYLPLSLDESGVAWFGPGAGFPLAAVTDSMFRVTWEEAGEYEFTLKIVAKDSEGEFNRQLASTTVTVNVVEGDAIVLEHATADAGAYVGFQDVSVFMEAISKLETQSGALTLTINGEDSFDYVVVSDVASNVSHVDNILFIFEVDKDGITKDDFEITAISLRPESETEGINNTFTVKSDTLKGYWGPACGFDFTGKAATAFTIQFNSAGDYTVKVYAIQVEKAEEADFS